jgi:hypothetical protein
MPEGSILPVPCSKPQSVSSIVNANSALRFADIFIGNARNGAAAGAMKSRKENAGIKRELEKT